MGIIAILKLLLEVLTSIPAIARLIKSAFDTVLRIRQDNRTAAIEAAIARGDTVEAERLMGGGGLASGVGEIRKVP